MGKNDISEVTRRKASDTSLQSHSSTPDQNVPSYSSLPGQDVTSVPSYSSLPELSMATERVHLKRRLGVHHGVALIMGLVVGSGIWVAPRGVLAGCGSPALTLLVWLGGGLLASMGAFCYAELGTTFPESGEKYIYLKRLYGTCPAFMYLWAYLLAVRPAGNAIKLITFSHYFLQALPTGLNCQDSSNKDYAIICITVVLACTLTFVNCVKIEWAAAGQNMFVLVTIIALSLISLIGLIWLGSGFTQYVGKGFSGTTTDIDGIALAFYNTLFAFGGWFALNFIIEELKDPYRNMPLAIGISMMLVTVLYLLVNLAYITVLDKQTIVTSNAVALVFGVETLGKAAFIIPLCIAVNTIGSFNAGILTGSRLFFVAARGGDLPDFLSLLNVRFLTPITSLILQCIMVIVYSCIGDIYFLISNLTFIITCFDMMTIAGMIYKRRREPNFPRPFKVPFIVLVVYFSCLIFLVCIPLFTKPKMTAITALIVLCTGLPYYLVFNVWKKKPVKFTIWSRKFTIVIQKIFYSVKQEEEY